VFLLCAEMELGLCVVAFLGVCSFQLVNSAAYGPTPAPPPACGDFIGNLDPNNEPYLRILTHGQAYYDSATNAIYMNDGQTNPNPGKYLTQIINKARANLRLLRSAHSDFDNVTGAECLAQSKFDFGAIGVVISHENDTVPEAAVGGGTILVGEPYYLHSLQANAAGFNPLVRLGANYANHPNPGKYLKIWIGITSDLVAFQEYLDSNSEDLAVCHTMNTRLGHAFQAFLVTVADPN